MQTKIAALLFAVAGLSSAQAQTSSTEPQLLVHGHYCGLGNRAPLPPVDALDRACARHDACTPPSGLPSRACNLDLLREADLISRDPRQPDDVRAAAGFAAFSAAVMPFDPASSTIMVVAPVASDPYLRQRVRPVNAY